MKRRDASSRRTVWQEPLLVDIDFADFHGRCFFGDFRRQWVKPCGTGRTRGASKSTRTGTSDSKISLRKLLLVIFTICHE
jgi:hypothetical protein